MRGSFCLVDGPLLSRPDLCYSRKACLASPGLADARKKGARTGKSTVQTQEGAINMAKVCEVCGKGPIVVNSVIRRGKARAAGGVGRKVTGVSKRSQKPNLQPLNVTRNGVSLRIRVCSKCRKSLS